MRQVQYDGACAVFSSPCLPVTCPIPQPPPNPRSTAFHYSTSPGSLSLSLLSLTHSSFFSSSQVFCIQFSFSILRLSLLLTVSSVPFCFFLFFLIFLPPAFSINASFRKIVHPKRHRTNRCSNSCWNVSAGLQQQQQRQCVPSVCPSVDYLTFIQLLALFPFQFVPIARASANKFKGNCITDPHQFLGISS